MNIVAAAISRARASGRSPSPDFPILFVLMALLVAAKAWDGVVLPQFWAEDGTDFFKDQFGKARPVLFTPSSGYLHVGLRLLAWLASLFPLRVEPAIYCYGAILFAALAFATLAHAVRREVPAVVSLGIIGLMPISTETHGVLANLQWILQFLLVPLLIPRQSPTSLAARAAWLLAIAILGLTGPFSLILLAVMAMLLALSPATRRTVFGVSGAAARIAVLAATAAIQAAFIFFSDNAAVEGGSLHLAALPIALANLPAALQGHLFAIQPTPLPASAFIVLLVTALAPVVSVALLRGDRDALLLTAAVGLGIGQSVLGMLKNLEVPPDVIQQVGVGDRYFVAAKYSLWLAFSASAAIAFGARHRKHAAELTLVCLLLVTIEAPSHLRRPPLEDKQWAVNAEAISRGKATSFPINPTPWTVDVPKQEEPKK